jgi:hypothetical protein
VFLFYFYFPGYECRIGIDSSDHLNMRSNLAQIPNARVMHKHETQRYEVWCTRFQRLSGVGLGGLLAALSAAAALLTLGGGDHRHPEEAAASKVST